jgi:hypothetical protein
MDRFVRLAEIIGKPNANPPIQGIFPIGRTTWLRGVREGRYPAPVSLGPRIKAWRLSDVLKVAE